MSLAEVETSMAALIGEARQRWQQVAAHLAHVQDRELWLDGGHTSFTAWVGSLAERFGYVESHLWRCLKATRIYGEWTGGDIVNCATGAEKLELAHKVLPHLDADEAVQLRHQVLANELSLATLRDLWSEHRPVRPGSLGPGPSSRAVQLPQATWDQLTDLAVAAERTIDDLVAELVVDAWKRRSGTPPAHR